MTTLTTAVRKKVLPGASCPDRERERDLQSHHSESESIQWAPKSSTFQFRLSSCPCWFVSHPKGVKLLTLKVAKYNFTALHPVEGLGVRITSAEGESV